MTDQGKSPNEDEVNMLLALLAVGCLICIPVLVCANYGIGWLTGLVASAGALVSVVGGVWLLLDRGGDA